MTDRLGMRFPLVQDDRYRVVRKPDAVVEPEDRLEVE